MNIMLTEDYKLTSDPYNIILQQRFVNQKRTKK